MSPTTTVNSLIFGPRAMVLFGGGTFVNVPTLLQVDGIPLIETIRNDSISKTTRFSIFNSDGTAFAEIIGTRLILTPAGERAGLGVTFQSRLTICAIGTKPVFEIRRVSAACLSITIELYSPKGIMVKSNHSVPFATYSKEGSQIAAAAASKRTLRNARIGFSVTDEGRSIGFGDQ